MDSAIKLFGRTIPLIEDQLKCNDKENSKILILTAPKAVDGELNSSFVEGKTIETDQQGLKEGNRALSVSNDSEDGVIKDSGKLLRKPGKVLPCPRCNSLDTKFCYFNNYNINQPRHFCKNCQRYWTAGGAMRNVPVGAGKRKNKNTGPNCLPKLPSEEMPSEGSQSASDVIDNSQNHSVSSDISSPLRHSKTLRFHQEDGSCESVTPFRNLGSETHTTKLDSSASGYISIRKTF